MQVAHFLFRDTDTRPRRYVLGFALNDVGIERREA
jgi:hypothetical protein